MNEQPRIQQVGRPDWPRYQIVLGECVWAGKGWDSNSSNALLFSNMKEVVRCWQEVMHAHFGDRPQLQLTTTVTVTVRATPGFRIDEFARYLLENASVGLDQGPIFVDAAVLGFEVDWMNLKPHQPPDDDKIFR